MDVVNRKIWAAALAVVVLVLANGARADFLYNDAHGMGSSWQGSKTYSSNTLYVRVDFCTYSPGLFRQSFPGFSANYDSQYVYAYQIYNDLTDHPDPDFADYVMRFTLGLRTSLVITSIGALSGSGAAPVASTLPDDLTAQWNFKTSKVDHQIRYPTKGNPNFSNVLYFTSPYSPEAVNYATVKGYYSDQNFLPTPTPEPATASLMLAWAVAMLRRAARKNRTNPSKEAVALRRESAI